jgi:hypothetical protein
VHRRPTSIAGRRVQLIVGLVGETDITFVVCKMRLDTWLALQNVVPRFAKSGHAALAKSGAIIYKLAI